MKKQHQVLTLAALYAKVSSDRQDVRPAGTRLAARLRIDQIAPSVSRDYPAATVLARCG